MRPDAHQVLSTCLLWILTWPFAEVIVTRVPSSRMGSSWPSGMEWRGGVRSWPQRRTSWRCHPSLVPWWFPTSPRPVFTLTSFSPCGLVRSGTWLKPWGPQGQLAAHWSPPRCSWCPETWREVEERSSGIGWGGHARQMDGLLPWQRQLYECEHLICQRDAILSEVSGPEGNVPLMCLLPQVYKGKSSLALGLPRWH